MFSDTCSSEYTPWGNTPTVPSGLIKLGPRRMQSQC